MYTKAGPTPDCIRITWTLSEKDPAVEVLPENFDDLTLLANEPILKVFLNHQAPVYRYGSFSKLQLKHLNFEVTVKGLKNLSLSNDDAKINAEKSFFPFGALPRLGASFFIGGEELKDKSINPSTFDVLRKMRPMRQMEAAELMATAATYTASYAKAILAATKQADLMKPDQPKRVSGLTAEQMTRMEREMAGLQEDVKAVEARYGDDMLHLVIAAGYLAKLVGNRNIRRYLGQHHPEILEEFTAIIASASLDGAAPRSQA